ncbi:putative disease resistance protein At1g63350 [Cryptomeria japonica]|uniref:putative disease resistance protein At1g63350 n=1 Tax=Cryptomeria japonica TaxID=3369 RepID=UPI0027DA0EF7|nr:putative disease resistance protein At1g63350 [Cryptomeria japonica]
MLWLTVSQNPSFNTLRDDLVKQITVQVNERLDSREEDHVKTWLNECMRKHKFALFLDDIWETSAASLLEELCVPHSPHHKSNIIIATSRTTSVLSQLGVRPSSLIEMQDLTENDGWRLFSFYAFPDSGGILPMSIDQEIAISVCKECGGLPLALKVIGKAMVSVTLSNEWELAVKKLQNDVTRSLYGRLRLSYDALADVAGYGISLQLCFLCLAAFSKGHVIYSNDAIDFWIGEGLVAGRDPLQIGDTYVILLADRCLIEPIQKDYDGNVICFRVHDVLHDLAQQIAEKEEKCFFQASKGLQEFPMVDCAGHIRISLEDNSLTRVPKEFRAPYIRFLLLSSNPSLMEIPTEVIGSMTALRVLDLSRTALQSLPQNMGCLKRLVYLGLSFVALKRLPNSVTTLKNLQILDLYRSDITQLPSGFSKLTSLKLLDVSFCKHLQCMPYGISRLTSLEYLDAFSSSNIQWNKCRRDRLPISDLCTLNKLKRSGLHNNGEIIQEGMLGTMKQIENPFCEFQNLGYLSLFDCGMLKQLPNLHNLPSLKHLHIVKCPNIEKFPEEFGKQGGFPKLEVFSVVKLRKLEQLPIVEEGALPSLKTLTIMKCEALQRLPQCYWNLKSVEKIRVYGCSKVLFVMVEEENFIKTKIKPFAGINRFYLF